MEGVTGNKIRGGASRREGDGCGNRRVWVAGGGKGRGCVGELEIGSGHCQCGGVECMCVPKGVDGGCADGGGG